MSTYLDRTQAEKADGLASLVLQYCATFTELINAASGKTITIDHWAPLAQHVAVDSFERIGSFKEVVTWREYLELLTAWAPGAQWESSFKRVTEAAPLVFLELEERTTTGDYTDVVNSLTLYEFDENRKLRHLDIYLQRKLASDVDEASGWGQRSSE